MSRGPRERIGKGETADYLGAAVPVELDATFKHGTGNGYKHRKCRCDACKGWKRHADRDRRAKRKAAAAAGELDTPHGTEVGYSKYYCRCTPCGDAHRTYMRDYREVAPGVTYSDRWRNRVQQETGATAHHHGDEWTGPELEIIVTRDDLSLPQLARLLGRTFMATASAKWRATHDPKWIQVVGVSGASVRDET